MITIIDYGVGNISSFQNVYKRLNIPCNIAKTKEDLDKVEKIILPGVGSFDNVMLLLNNSGMRDRLDELVLNEKTPILGVCVGMQIMGNNSDEGNLEGLKWIDANTKKLDESLVKHRTKLPHMGWNNVLPAAKHSLFEGIEPNPIFYFLHSYYLQCNNIVDSIATTNYGNNFTSAIQHENIYGTQFHPEKSHNFGQILLDNFTKI